jgi:hypothetical protein
MDLRVRRRLDSMICCGGALMSWNCELQSGEDTVDASLHLAGVNTRQSLVDEVEHFARRLTAEEKLELINRLFGSLADSIDPLSHADSMSTQSESEDVLDLSTLRGEDRIDLDAVSARYKDLLEFKSLADLFKRS